MNEETLKMIKKEIENQVDTINVEKLSDALSAILKAYESEKHDDIEQAKDLVSELPTSDLKKVMINEIKRIPRRLKINSLSELKEKGLCIIDDEETTVVNHIMKILLEKGLLLSDLSKLTGISRQNINAVVNNKMKPGIDFALKVSYVLGIAVEDIFALTDTAWVKPYKQERDSAFYLDIMNLEILDNTAKKENISKNGFEYYNTETKTYMSRETFASELRDFLKKNTKSKVAEMKEQESNISVTKLNSLAKEVLTKEFNKENIKIYRKLGEKINPYIINSKKVVRNRESSDD